MLVFSPLARRQFRALPARAADQMLAALEAFVTNPSASRNVRKLEGYHGAYRLRSGSFRAIFRFDEARNVVVESVFDRKNAPY